MAGCANAHVARLAVGDHSDGEYCGLVLNCSWPMPPDVLEQYEVFRAKLSSALPREAYIYPGSSLHCTILTMRSFTAGPLDETTRAALREKWVAVLDTAGASPDWPSGPFRLRMNRPTLENVAGIFLFDDLDGAILKMRGCLRKEIERVGGCAIEGFGDKSLARPIPGSPPNDPPPHIPGIIHSTVLRWAAEPSVDRTVLKEAFDAVAASWSSIEFLVTSSNAVIEDAPYMHIPFDDAHVFWSSSHEKHQEQDVREDGENPKSRPDGENPDPAKAPRHAR